MTDLPNTRENRPGASAKEQAAPSFLQSTKLRLLDFDDFLVLSFLLRGYTIAATAKQLGLTQPAITQRVRKMDRVFGEPLIERVGRHIQLTEMGRRVCEKATAAVAIMDGPL